jgi:small subunit ribosomal protein S12
LLIEKKTLISNRTTLIMTSFVKLLRCRKRKQKRNRKKALQMCPQKFGVCLRVYTSTPIKPNSGIRKVAKIKLSHSRNIIAHIPGIGHNLQEHSCVLVRGGRVRDIPGIQYRVIRGLLDCKPVTTRITARSKYGMKLKK